MDGINWNGLSRVQNPFASFAEGYQTGDAIRQQRMQTQMLQRKQQMEEDKLARELATTQAAEQRKRNVGTAISAGNYAGAITAADGDLETIKAVQAMQGEERKAAAERSGVLVAYVDSLKGPDGKPLPPDQAKAAILRDAEGLMQLGFTQDQLANFDPTPQNLARLRAQALGLKGVLEQQDREGDNAREDRRDKATQTFREGQLAISRGNLAVAQSNNARGWAAHRARQAAGGYGTPGVGSAGISDDDVEIDP